MWDSPRGFDGDGKKPKTSKIYVLRSQRPRGDVFMQRAERTEVPQLTFGKRF